MRWYYFLIAGAVVSCLLCACTGAVYWKFGRGNGDIAACDLALKDNHRDSKDSDDSAGFRQFAADTREAADAAESSDLRTALLMAAAATDRVIAADEAYNSKSGIDAIPALQDRAQALHETGQAMERVLTSCQQAGWTATRG